MGCNKYLLKETRSTDKCVIYNDNKSNFPTLVINLCLGSNFSEKSYTKMISNQNQVLNKRPMGHIAHLRKQFKSINTYDYIITLKREKKHYLVNDNLLVLHLKKLKSPSPKMLCAKFFCKCARGFREECFLIPSSFFPIS